jgi:PTS system glucitol/sorbitol-specific IIA component
MRRFETKITDVADEARELVEGGVLILFADGAPPELAEVSVLHRVVTPPSATAPSVGARLAVAGVSTEITAIGEYAWRKIGEIGHVVINFNGGTEAPRPGEISVKPVDLAALSAALLPGQDITVDD